MILIGDLLRHLGIWVLRSAGGVRGPLLEGGWPLFQLGYRTCRSNSRTRCCVAATSASKLFLRRCVVASSASKRSFSARSRTISAVVPTASACGSTSGNCAAMQCPSTLALETLTTLQISTSACQLPRDRPPGELPENYPTSYVPLPVTPWPQLGGAEYPGRH